MARHHHRAMLQVQFIGRNCEYRLAQGSWIEPIAVPILLARFAVEIDRYSLAIENIKVLLLQSYDRELVYGQSYLTFFKGLRVELRESVFLG